MHACQCAALHLPLIFARPFLFRCQCFADMRAKILMLILFSFSSLLFAISLCQPASLRASGAFSPCADAHSMRLFYLMHVLSRHMLRYLLMPAALSARCRDAARYSLLRRKGVRYRPLFLRVDMSPDYVAPRSPFMPTPFLLALSLFHAYLRAIFTIR